MLKRIDLNKCAGKTIKNTFKQNNQILIVYTDDTYTYFECKAPYMGYGANIQEKDIDISNFPLMQLLKVGVVTQAEYDSLKKQQAPASYSIKVEEIE